MTPNSQSDGAIARGSHEIEHAALDLLRAARIAERLCEENCSQPDPPPMERLEDAAFAAQDVRKRAEALADRLGE